MAMLVITRDEESFLPSTYGDISGSGNPFQVLKHIKTNPGKHGDLFSLLRGILYWDPNYSVLAFQHYIYIYGFTTVWGPHGEQQN